MSEKESSFKLETIGQGEDQIYIWTPIKSGVTGYSAIYGSRDTLNLNSRFNLDHTAVIKGSNRDKALDKAVELTSLGHTGVEHLMRYFVALAKWCATFVGLPEQELRRFIETNQQLQLDYKLKPRLIETACNYIDSVYDGSNFVPTTYLKRATVKGIDVLFPTGLARKD